MKIRQFIPLGLSMIVVPCVWAAKTEVPVPPIALISTVGVTMIFLQLEDRKWGDYLANIIRAFKPDDKHHA